MASKNSDKKETVKDKLKNSPSKTISTKTSKNKNTKKNKSTKSSSASKSSKKKSNKNPQTMEELLEVTGYELKAPKKNQVIDGLITDISRRMVLVDIGGKTEGMVVDKEYENAKDLISEMSIGDTIRVYVMSPENERGQILLSLRKAASDRKWGQFSEYLETSQTVKVTGIEVNRGGLIVQVDSVRGFVPSSQFSKEYLGRMDLLVNKDFKVQVIEVDREKNRLIFSERHVSEADAMAQKTLALDTVKKNGVYKGVVSGIMPFGVFVTVDIPLELPVKSKSKTKSTSKKTTKVKPKDKKKTNDKSFEIIGKIEGLIHISEISWEKVEDPNKYFNIGNNIEVMVIGINQDSGKLNLSVKRLENDPWQEIEKNYVVGSKVSGTVTRVAPFGVFVTLEPGVDGLIHISKVPAGDEPKVGDKIDVYVESLDKQSRRMSLGIVLKEVPVGYK